MSRLWPLALAALVALLAVPLAVMAGAAVVHDLVPPAAASPVPTPTPCRVYHVGEDGSVSCLAIPMFGMEPYP